MNTTTEVSPRERVERLSRWGNIRRDRLIRILDALDARRHRTVKNAKNIERQVEQTALPIGAVAAALVGAWVVVGVIRSRARVRRSPIRRFVARHAERLELVPRQRHFALEVLRGILVSVATYGGSLVAKRALAAAAHEMTRRYGSPRKEF
jgi:hypothetical protein